MEMREQRTKVFYYLDDYFHFDNLIDRLDTSKVDVYSLLGSYRRIESFQKGLCTSYDKKESEERFWQGGIYCRTDLSFAIQTYFDQNAKEIFAPIQKGDDVIFFDRRYRCTTSFL